MSESELRSTFLSLVRRRGTAIFCFNVLNLIHFSRHNSVPRVPAIPGLKSFPGMVMHSHDYRYPEIFQGMDVVILGAAASGKDICLHVARCAKRVYLSHKGTALVCSLPDNVTQCRPIKSLSSDGTVMFDDGTSEKEVDAILLCTGYKMSFPFLDDACGIRIRDNRVTHLYKHIFSAKNPTLAFAGICNRFCGFTHINLQVQYIASVLSQRKQLPTEEEMNADEEKEFEELLSIGMEKRHAHYLQDYKGGKWCYDKTIAQLAGIDAPSPIYIELCRYVLNRRQHYLVQYKNENFELTSDGSWTTINGDLMYN